ncbi:alpha/beta fold hydrolase [Hydrogenophaga aquatica]
MSPLPTFCTPDDACDAIVLLPGAAMTAAQLLDAGLDTALRTQGRSLRLITLDTPPPPHSVALLHALDEQVLAPARQRHRRVWLGGISYGGMLAMAHAACRPALDGLCLLAPYPGSRVTRNAIERAGGLDAWQATPEQQNDVEFLAWQWLQARPVSPPIFLGHGKSDRFADSHQRMAQRLPAATCVEVDGGHDWATWLALWSRFLAIPELEHVA